jgi:hypothetical protein
MFKHRALPHQRRAQKPTNGAKPQETAWLAVGNHHADLIHVGGEQNLFASVAHAHDQVS